TVGVLIDGCPAGIALSTDDFMADLQRRRSGGVGSTRRKESDIPIIKSGVYENHTTGSPILIEFENLNTRSADYNKLKNIPRPGHADFTASKKFEGFNDPRGGGAFSGRLTVGLVATGVIAKKIIGAINIKAELIEVGGESDIESAVLKVVKAKDSIGGIIECRAENLPVGLGEPFFDSVESCISHAIFSIPGIKGIEFGSGFEAARMKGSEHNDPIIDIEGKTSTNNAGGINGGISNGNDLFFRVAVKPTSSIGLPQKTINLKSWKPEELIVGGRHDSCFALRVPVIVEAVTACVLADFSLIGL
ncbi:MAG: chorismate synthase, partial [Chlorobi bacterium]|nr:chorismate synthase [Chlorobiota bacterium]